MSAAVPPDASRSQAIAKSRRGDDDERCRNWAIKGSTTCRIHGSAAGHVRRAAQRRVAARKVEREVRAALATESVGPVRDPYEALALLAAEALSLKEVLAARVNELASLRKRASVRPVVVGGSRGTHRYQQRSTYPFWPVLPQVRGGAANGLLRGWLR
jgi:hypothetical protein